MKWTQANLSEVRRRVDEAKLYFLAETDLALASYEGETVEDVVRILREINEANLRALCGVDEDPK